MVTLHIKGDMRQVFNAADERRIELTSIQCRYRAGIAECFVSAEARFEPKARAWYHEDAELIMGYGYPAGTVLHFNSEG